MEHRLSRHLLIIFALSCALMGPAFFLGAGGNDLQCQVLRVKLFSQQFWNGELYPRWLMDMFAGRGSPVFFFYPPLAYFVAAFFYGLAPLDALGYHPIAASLWLAVFLSGVAFYGWIREETTHPEAALIASLLYMAAPEHVAIDFYSYLMPGTLWVYVWVPLLLLAARRLMAGSGGAAVAFAVLLCFLILSNVPQTVIWGPVAVLYAATWARKGHAPAPLVRLALAAALGFGLAAFYLLPMLSYKSFVMLDAEWGILQLGNATFDKTAHIFFLKEEIIPDNALLSAWYVLTFVLLMAYFRQSHPGNARKFFAAACLAGLLLMTPVTLPLWKLFPVKIIQLAERFFTLTSFCLACLCAYAYPRLRLFSYGWVAAFVIITLVFATHGRTTLAELKEKDPVLYRQYRLNIDQYVEQLTSPDLIPLYKGFTLYRGRFGGMIMEPLEIETDTDPVTVINGRAIVDVREWNPRSILLRYKAGEPSTLLIRQFMFPGFTASLGDMILTPKRDEHSGQIVLEVPAGVGDIRLELTALVPEILGKLVSLVSAVIVLLAGLVHLRVSKIAVSKYSDSN